MNNLLKWLESLPDTCAQLIVRAGEKRSEENIIYKTDLPVDNLDTILDDIQDHLPWDSCKFRAIALDEKGRQVKAITINGDRPHATIQQQDISDPIQTLVNGLLAMVQENRRVMSVLADVIEDREQTMSHVIDSMIQAKTEQVESDLAIGQLEIEKAYLEEKHTESIKEKALTLASATLEKMTAPKLTPEIIKQYIIDNPAIIDVIAGDEKITNLIASKLNL